MSARQKAKGLIELALDERTPDKERIAAAFRACALIRKRSLLDNPLDALDGIVDGSNETVQAVKTIFTAFTDPKVVSGAKKIRDKIKSVRRR